MTLKTSGLEFQNFVWCPEPQRNELLGEFAGNAEVVQIDYLPIGHSQEILIGWWFK